jgi:hypothetical protein
MRNYSKTVGALAAASTLVAGNASAEILTGFDGEVHVGYSNMYEFRFVDRGNDLIEAGVDLAYDAGMFGLSAGAWYGVWDTPGVAGAMGGRNNDELDLYAGVSYSIQDLTLELGHITYYFPDSSGATSHEVYLSADYELPFGLGFNSTYYYDWERRSGYYWDNSVGYSYAINECLSAEVGAGVAFADGHALQARATAVGGTTKDGLQGWYLTAALPWEFRDGVTLTPYVKYTDGEDDLATNIAGNGGQDFFIAGVSLAVGF